MSYWNEKHFKVFETPGLEARMAALAEKVRPKFEELGDQYSAYFSGKTGEEFHPHVAKHMRRTVNPPNDSWVAFAPNKRGYKAVPHFQIGLWESHVFIILAVIYEANGKAGMAERLLDSELIHNLPGDMVLSGDHMKPEASSVDELGEEGLKKLLERLRDVKKGEFVIGRHLEREEADRLSKEQFDQLAEKTFDELLPIYNTMLGNNNQ
ncbi:YktB family protein [Planomicrobium okeanokoites]|uniref:YktB family protein n=1 Tax=Planomicrobium okeanokoites TaxID=244 RepID=UPI0035686568